MQIVWKDVWVPQSVIKVYPLIVLNFDLPVLGLEVHTISPARGVPFEPSFSRTISKGGWKLGVIVDGAIAAAPCSALNPHDCSLRFIMTGTC